MSDKGTSGPVSDAATDDLRERIAQALWMVDGGPKHVDDWWDEGTYEARKARYYERADAVLAVLEGWVPPQLEQVGEYVDVDDLADLLADEWPYHVDWRPWEERRRITEHLARVAADARPVFRLRVEGER